MNTTPRKMPSELAIRAHWAKRLWAIKGYDSEAEFLERGTCFACGMDGKEKAHIVARVVGGDDSPENLHILCSVCHKDSEYLDGDRYMAWLVERSPVDMFMSSAMRCGFNPAAMMQLNNIMGAHGDPDYLRGDMSCRHVDMRTTKPRKKKEVKT